MFRIRQLARNPQLFCRISPPLPQDSKFSEFAHVRQVKFKRPWIRNLLSTCAVYGVAFHIWNTYVFGQLDDDDDADTPRKSDIEGKDKIKISEKPKPELPGVPPHDENAVFIPLGMPRLQEAEFYAASDPEWQQFVKIAKDRQRLISLKDELAKLVLSNASRSTLVSQVLGGPLTLTSAWLVHRFPSRAPPQYTRPGIEIGDQYVSLGFKRLSSEEGDRLSKFMRPLVVTFALKDASLVYLRRKLARLRDNGSAQEGTENDQTLAPPDQKMLPDLQNVDGLSHFSRPESQLPYPNSHQEDMAQEKPSLHPSLLISSLQRLPLPELGPSSDFYAASLAFKWRLNEGWARQSHTPRRGTFHITGPVGLQGPKGFCRIEVKGEYDPSSSRWTNVSMQLRDLIPHSQRPLGGRQ